MSTYWLRGWLHGSLHTCSQFFKAGLAQPMTHDTTTITITMPLEWEKYAQGLMRKMAYLSHACLVSGRSPTKESVPCIFSLLNFLNSHSQRPSAGIGGRTPTKVSVPFTAYLSHACLVSGRTPTKESVPCIFSFLNFLNSHSQGPSAGIGGRTPTKVLVPFTAYLSHAFARPTFVHLRSPDLRSASADTLRSLFQRVYQGVIQLSFASAQFSGYTKEPLSACVSGCGLLLVAKNINFLISQFSQFPFTATISGCYPTQDLCPQVHKAIQYRC